MPSKVFKSRLISLGEIWMIVLIVVIEEEGEEEEGDSDKPV